MSAGAGTASPPRRRARSSPGSARRVSATIPCPRRISRWWPCCRIFSEAGSRYLAVGAARLIPAGEEDQLEAGRDAPLGIRVALGIEGGGLGEELSARKPSGPGGERIGLSHAAEIAHQGERVGICDRQPLG